MKSLIDGKTPGQFRARCNMARPLAIQELPHYLRREFEEKGWKKATREVPVKGRLRLVPCYLEPLCDGFETTDRGEFERHMAEAHGKKPRGPRQIKKGNGLWRGPRLTEEGKPWVDPSKKPREPLTRTCASCGLVAEVDDRPANVLWWAEHERMCVGAEQPEPRTGNCIQVGHNYAPHPETDHCLVFVPVAGEAVAS